MKHRRSSDRQLEMFSREDCQMVGEAVLGALVMLTDRLATPGNGHDLEAQAQRLAGPYVSLQEAAHRLKLSPWTLYKIPGAELARLYGARKIGGYWQFPVERLNRASRQPVPAHSRRRSLQGPAGNNPNGVTPTPSPF